MSSYSRAPVVAQATPAVEGPSLAPTADDSLGSVGPAPVVAAPGGGNPTLRRGSTGAAVARLQGSLNTSGASLAVDGIFGPLTDGAVRSCQASQWGGSLPASVQTFFRNHILDRQPYSPPTPQPTVPGAAVAPPPRPTGMSGTP